MIYPRTHDNGKKDKRYQVTLEYVGEAKPRYVLRFCDKYLGDFLDIPAAALRAIGHHNELMGAYIFTNQDRA